MDGRDCEAISKMMAGMRTLSEIEEICRIAFEIVGKKTYDDKSAEKEVVTALQNIAKMADRYNATSPDPVKVNEYAKGVMAVELPSTGYPKKPNKTMIDPLTGVELKRCCCCDILKPMRAFEQDSDTCKACETKVKKIQREKKKAPADEAEA